MGKKARRAKAATEVGNDSVRLPSPWGPGSALRRRDRPSREAQGHTASPPRRSHSPVRSRGRRLRVTTGLGRTRTSDRGTAVLWGSREDEYQNPRDRTQSQHTDRRVSGAAVQARRGQAHGGGLPAARGRACGARGAVSTHSSHGSVDRGPVGLHGRLSLAASAAWGRPVSVTRRRHGWQRSATQALPAKGPLS